MPQTHRRSASTASPARAVVAVLAATSLTLSACSTLPQNSSPKVLHSFEPAATPEPSMGPRAGEEPDLLLRDFYAASALPAGDYSAARSFMTEEAAGDWDPDQQVLIVDSLDIITNAEADSTEGGRSFNVRGSVIGTLSEGGSYTSENGGFEAQIHMTQVDGEWRISDLPEVVVIERTELRNRYQPHSLFFYEHTGQALESDRRWLSTGQESLDTELITLLLQGPAEELAPATMSVVPREANFGGIEDGVYHFTGMSDMSQEDRTRFAAELVWTLSTAGIPGPYRVVADDAPLVEGLDELTTDDFADYNPKANTDAATSLYAVTNGNVVRLSGNETQPLHNPAANAGNVESAEISAEETFAAVRKKGADKTQLVLGTLNGDVAESLEGESITRPTFGITGRGAWVAVDGKKIYRVVRSTTGEVSEQQINADALDGIDGEISVMRLSSTGARVAFIIGGAVYSGVVAQETDGDYRIVNVRELASELGRNALSLDWQPDGSLVVGTSSTETPVWRIEQDGSSLTTLPSGNITAPVVSVAASPTTVYLTDANALLRLPSGESDSVFWREVPGLQGVRAAPIVGN